MKLIVGLGNPGTQYARTRHNVGFMAIDRLADRHAPGAPARQRFHSLTVETSIPGAGACMLVKPLTYMNRSGLAVGEAVRFYKVDPGEDLLVIVDDVALPSGLIRIRARGSAGGHNGLADIERVLATDAYPRLRIGIDEPGMIPQADYVLGKFTPEQQERIDPALDRAADATELWMSDGVDAAMNRFNQREPKPSAADGSQQQQADSSTSPADGPAQTNRKAE